MILTVALVKTSLFLVPSLRIEMPLNHFYLAQESSAECQPLNLKVLNPVNATWIVETGAKYNGFRAFIGHKSYHGIEHFDATLKSVDYAGLEYKGEFK